MPPVGTALSPSSPLNQLDTRKLGQELGSVALDILRPLLSGTAADINRFVLAIGRNSAAALLLPPDRRENVLRENRLQLPVLAEKQRVRLNNSTWDTVGRAVEIIDRITPVVAGAITRLAII